LICVVLNILVIMAELSLLVLSGMFGVGVVGFKVVVDQPIIPAAIGGSVNITCRANNYYEYCKFTNPVGETCNFEWRRKQWNVTMKKCKISQEKIKFVASYDAHECGIEVSNLEALDVGIWKCEVEQYVFGGSRGSGLREEKRINVFIPTSTSTTTTTTSTRAPSTRQGRNLEDMFERINVPDFDAEDKVSRAGTGFITKVFHMNIVSGCVALIVVIIFIMLFVYLVLKHRQKQRESDVEEMPIVPSGPDRKTRLRTSQLIEGSLSPTSMSTASKRTSLSSIVPSILEETAPNSDQLHFMTQIFPHIISLEPEEKRATVL